ncbi:hypothetical protein AAG570_001824, partial [Ranatra chinensis]
SGLWLKTDTYREQPDVHFKYEYLILLETDRIEQPIICTTFPSLERSVKKFNKCPFIKVREEDVNRDGRNDLLHFEAQAVLPSSEIIQGATLMLLFDYKLYSHTWLEMESIGYLNAMTPMGGAQLNIFAELRLHQKQALMSRGRDARYNISVVQGMKFHLPTVLEKYATRNVTTHFQNVYTTWTRGRAQGQPFILRAVIQYPEEIILYAPGFWHIIKFAWLQYFSVLVPFILLGRKLKQFILGNSLVHSIKEPPWKK